MPRKPVDWSDFPLLEMFFEGRVMDKKRNSFAQEVIYACLAEQLDDYLFPQTVWTILITLPTGD